MKIFVAEIEIGSRVRKHPGDLKSLQSSMERLGQLVPIGVSVRQDDGKFRYVLVHGWRRLATAKKLGWKQIDARILEDLDDLAHLLAERDENVERQPLTLSEREEFARQILPLEKAAAKKRLQTSKTGKLPEAEKGEALTKVAAAVGMSRNTYRKVREVVAAAEKNPKRFGALKCEMDQTGKVSPAYSKLQRLQKQSGLSRTDEELEAELFRVAAQSLERLAALKGKRQIPMSGRARTALTALNNMINELLDSA